MEYIQPTTTFFIRISLQLRRWKTLYITPLVGGGYEVSLKPVPEPTTMLLLGFGLLGLAGYGIRRGEFVKIMSNWNYAGNLCQAKIKLT